MTTSQCSKQEVIDFISGDCEEQKVQKQEFVDLEFREGSEEHGVFWEVRLKDRAAAKIVLH